MNEPLPELVGELLEYFGYSYEIGRDETLARENLHHLMRSVQSAALVRLYPLRNYIVRVLDLHGYSRSSVGKVLGEIKTDMYVIYHGKGEGTLYRYVRDHDDLLSEYELIGSSGSTAENKLDGVSIFATEELINHLQVLSRG